MLEDIGRDTPSHYALFLGQSMCYNGIEWQSLIAVRLLYPQFLF